MSRLAAAVLVLVALVAACSSGGGRADTVAGIVDEVIVPGFEAATTATTGLENAADAFCAEPSTDTLDAARDAWHEAVTSWNATEVAWEGPVKMDRIDTLVHYPDVDTDAVDELLAGHTPGEPFDAADLASVVRGLGTAEYLLFTSDDPAEVADPARCDLLRAVTAGASVGAAAAEAAWVEGWDGGPAYAEVLAGRADDGMETPAAMAELVRGVDSILSQATVQGLGLALGVTREEPLPDELDEGAAGAAGDVLAARIAGIEAVYDPPGDTPGLGDLVAGQSEEVHQAVVTELGAATDALDALGTPLVPALAESPDEAMALYDALVELRRSFQSDVASLLDITVGFSDTDGDSG